MITRRILLAAAASTLVLAACSDSDKEATQKVTVENVWARQSPMATDLGAVYLDITSSVDDTLTGVSVPASVARTTEIHEMAMVSNMGDSGMTGDSGTMGDSGMSSGGEMVMREVDEIDLPAGTTVSLKPGGYHVMLIGLVNALKAGDTFEVTLTLGSGTTTTATATVRETAPE